MTERAYSRVLPSLVSARVKVLGALLIVYLCWGSSYAAITIMLRSIPPLTGTALRFLIASALLTLVVTARTGVRRLRLPLRHYVNAAVTGLLVLGIARALVSMAQQYISSGLTAVIVASVPLWILLLRYVSREHPPTLSMIAVAAGFVGICQVLLPSGSEGGEMSVQGLILLLIAALSEAVGAFGTSRLDLPDDPLVIALIQALTAGIGLSVAAFGMGELSTIDPMHWEAASVLALLYLAVPSGVIPLVALIWLLRNASVSVVSTYAYVNPVVALLIGGLFLHERLTPDVLRGTAFILAAVVVVENSESAWPRLLWKKRDRKRTARIPRRQVRAAMRSKPGDGKQEAGDSPERPAP
jgi:drug/metabolite transporter (DMT)-like permease